MKIARRSLQSALDDDVYHTNSTNSSSQLAVAGKDASQKRALSRKTRAAVEAWIEKLFMSDRQSKQHQREVTRRASTGSLSLGSSGSGVPVEEPQAKRRSSLFSSRGKENSNSNNNNNSNTRSKKAKAPALWLQPVTSLPQLECDNSTSKPAIELITSASDVKSLREKQHEELLMAYVTPPVEMPSTYRQQDRRGGMIVSGRAVLFTNAAFKRKLRKLSQLHVIPESRPAQMLESRLDVYLTALENLESIEAPLSSSSASSEDVSDIIPLSQWI